MALFWPVALVHRMQYDRRAMNSRELHSLQGIYVRDQESTRFRRLQRALNRQGTKAFLLF